MHSKDEILTESVASPQFDYSWKLPEEITSQILSRLPVKSVMRCRCVCKAWRSFLKDPHFVSMHLTRTYKKKERKKTCQNFVSYNPIRNQATPLAVQAPPNIRHTYVHVGSLVSPHIPMTQLAESGPKITCGLKTSGPRT